MTLHQLLDLSTMEHRHLLLSYVLVAGVQIGYLVWVLRSRRNLRRRPGRD